DRGLDHRAHGAPRRDGAGRESPRGGHGGRDAAPEEAGMTAATRAATGIGVFVVGDHELLRSGVRSELSRGCRLVGDAGTVDEAVAGILREEPEVVLLDVHMPAGGGRAVIEGVRAAGSKAQFLALSVSDAAEDVIGIIRAGARGYVTKSISADELM